MVDHDLQIREAFGDFRDFIDGKVVNQNVESQAFFRKQAQIPPYRIGKEIFPTRTIPHPNSNETGILGKPVKQAREFIRTDRQVANQGQVTVRVMLDQIENPLVVLDPTAGLHDYRGRDAILVSHRIEVLG